MNDKIASKYGAMQGTGAAAAQSCETLGCAGVHVITVSKVPVIDDIEPGGVI